MPFYTYRDSRSENHEFMLPVDHEIPVDNYGKKMKRVYKSSHYLIVNVPFHEKSKQWQQGRIDEKEY